MNKEFDLTRQAQNQYSGSMPDAVSTEQGISQEPAPSRPTRQELTPEQARQYWEKYEYSRGGLDDAQTAKRNSDLAGQTQTEAEVGDDGNVVVPGIDATGITNQDALDQIRYLNLLHDRGEVDKNEVLSRMKVLQDKKRELLEQIRDEADAQRRGAGERQVDQINDAIKRLNEATPRTREDSEAAYSRNRYEGNLTVKTFLLKDRKARDAEFNDIFAGVDADPSQFFDRAFNPLTIGARYEEFMDVIRNASGRGYADVSLSDQEIEDLKQDLTRYQLEKQTRQTLHDANAILYLPSIKGEQLWDNMQQFDTSQADLALRLPGVREMMDLYEQTLRESMARNDGYLRPEEVRGDIRTKDDGKGTIISVNRGITETEAKRRFREMVNKGQIYTKFINEDGKLITRAIDPMEDWEIDRTFTTARGMMIMTERLLSIAAESKLPVAGGGRITSLFLQDVLQQYSPYIHLFAKYGVGEKSLAAYLHTPDERHFFDLIKGWDPKKMHEVWELLEKDPSKVLDQSLNEPNPLMPYLTRRNPNRAGDIYTWISWRAGANDPNVVSMSQEFLTQGVSRMRARLALKPAGISEEQYLGEYGNWIGTGLRFERLRGDLENHHSERHESAHHQAMGLLEKMTDLQSQRLYLNSSDIRERMAKVGWDLKATDTAQALEDLQLVESEFLKQREDILDAGLTFDSLSLDNSQFNFFNVISDPVRRQKAMDFREAMMEDFRQNDKLYEKEYITLREYKHGYVLWTGDVPMDEFNAAAIGATGFARRGRDNKAQAGAAVEEIKMLGALKKIKDPHQLIELLEPIYEKIGEYDTGKAKAAIAEKVEGIIKFYRANGATNIPIIGIYNKIQGHSSLAQMMYGKTAAVWEAQDVRLLVTELEHMDLINEHQAEHLYEVGLGKVEDVAMNAGVTIAQLAAVAFMLYMLSQVQKDGSGHH